MLRPGAILGVLGGGQLGRMFCVAAQTMGYTVWVLDRDPYSPAGAIADRHLQASYEDRQALAEMAEGCAAITTEFENVPADTLIFLEQHCIVRPGSRAVAIAQNRIREKTSVQEFGLATAPFAAIHKPEDLTAAFETLTPPLLLKTAAMGYDGKGQRTVNHLEEAVTAFEELGGTPCVLEKKVDLEREISVLLARSENGEVAVYPPGENHHVHGILDTTRVPAQLDSNVEQQAIGMARDLASRLEYVGVLAVEFFLTRQGELLINELAPRPHNSGHYTLDATLTSQFEQQVRTLCGMPPGDTRLLSPVVMVNILGDLWEEGEPPWERLFAHPCCKLHLYGKKEARPGRKMGHYNCLEITAEAAEEMAEQVRTDLRKR
jgi:5-(carboxyamino)imidazole ribonucleotide synthase